MQIRSSVSDAGMGEEAVAKVPSLVRRFCERLF
jgi:hypothetical protein